MKMSEITNEQLDEAAPMGFISRGVQGLKSLVPGSIGNKATGSLQTGKKANELMAAYQTWLGQIGAAGPTKENLSQWMTSMRLPLDQIDAVLKAGTPPAPVPPAVPPTPAVPPAPVPPAKRTRKPPTPTPTPESLREATAMTDAQVSKVLLATVQQDPALQQLPVRPAPAVRQAGGQNPVRQRNPTQQRQTSPTPPAVPPATPPTPPGTPPAVPSGAPLGAAQGVKPGRLVVLPGTKLKFKYTPTWTDTAGNTPTPAVIKVLNQLAAGKNPASINPRDLAAAKQSMNIPEGFRSNFLNRDI